MLLAEKSILYFPRIGGVPQIECRICKESGHLSYVCDKRVNQVKEPEKQEDQKAEAEPLAVEEMSIEDDTINVEGPTGFERKIVQSESNETVKDTVDTSDVMVAEYAVQGCKRDVSDSDPDGKTQHRRTRIHTVPKFSAGKRRDKNASSSAAKKSLPISFHNVHLPTRLVHRFFVFTLFLIDSINDHSG